MKRPLLLSLLLLLTLVGRVMAQDRTISGRVLDKATNEGIPGASVILKGTSVGTATNANGNFSLSVPAGATTLQFKYLGYVNVERAIDDTNTVDVALAVDTKVLNEVVITANNIPRQEREIGYALSTVKPDQLVQKSEPDVLRTLAGKVPGVNISSVSSAPGASTRIIIRGFNSITGENGPLFVVDGVPYSNQQIDSDNPVSEGTGAYSNRTIDIDPNNIASWTLLKGAAASAQYGSRGAGGVVLITTKSGSGQRGAKGLTVGYNTSYSTERAILPQYQNSFGSGANFGGAYNTNGSWGPRFDSERIGSIGAPAYIPLYGVVKNAGLNLLDSVPYRAYPNNVKDFFQTGHVYENSVSLAGTGDNATFSAVLSRSEQVGTIPTSGFTRNNVSVGGSGTYKKLTVGGNVGYTNSEQRSPQIGSGQALGGASVLSRVMFLPRTLDLTGLPSTNPLDNSSQFAWLTTQADNPYWSVNNNSYVSRVDRVVAGVNASYAFTDWLQLSYVGGLNTYSEFRRNTTRAGGTSRSPTGRIVEDNIRNTELDQTIRLAFDRNLTEDFSLKVILLNNVNQRQFESTSFLGTGVVQYGIDNIGNTNVQKQYGPGYSKRRLVGVLGDVTLGYRNWAFVNFTGRQDFSSTLNVNGDAARGPGGSFFYPGTSGSLIVNEALNLSSLAWLSLVKLRGSYGRVGNDAQPYRAGPALYTVNPGGYGGNGGGLDFPFVNATGAALFNRINNATLTPEFTNEWEAGADLGFFNRRISFNGTYYDRRTTSQIADVTLATATGFGSFTTNFGEISNKGVELALTLVPVQTSWGLTWTSTTNFTRNRNVVESLTEGLTQVSLASSFASPQSVLRPGEEYGIIVGTAAARDSLGNLLINPTTGRYLADKDPKVIGNPNARYTMGFINSVSYKGITLSALVDYRKGGSIYSSTLQSELGRGVTKDTEDREKIYVLKGVLGNPSTLKPILVGTGADRRLVYNTLGISTNDYYFGAGGAAINGFAEQQVYDATIWRLREASLGYDLPKDLLAKTPFGTVNISLSGRNLYWFTPNIPKYANFDPETSTYSSGSNGLGIEYLTLPSSRRYGVNLRVTF